MAQDQNLLLQLEELRAENRRLRQLLAEHGIPFEERKPAAAETAVHEAAAPGKARLSTREKMSLFRSLFCGREDVFAKRWHSMKDGREGYQPVCANEWRPGVCSKKKYSCAVCPFRQLLPLSDRDIYFHLKGADEFCRDVVGVYAIFPDDTCRFLCTDFDDKSSEHGYRDDVIAFTGVCRDWGIPCSVERSRSGRGAHVWILFEKNIPAAKARRLGDAILTEAMNRSGRMSFKSYDRFFPNQDRMPEGGFGNLVALPLQGKARRSGNSVFVDENFEMYPDQWGYLLSVRKMSEAAADAILAMHSAGADLFGAESRQPEESPQQEKKTAPWEAPIKDDIPKVALPESITLTRADRLYIPLGGLPPKAVACLRRLASFKNPEFYSRQAMRLPTWNIPRIISCAELDGDYLALPRGCGEAAASFFSSHETAVTIEDKTNHGKNISVEFRGELRQDQDFAVQEMLRHNTGVLSAATAFGKTVTAIGMIARLHVSTLILIHSRSLLRQWVSRLKEFLIIHEKVSHVKWQRSDSPIGCLCSGKSSLRGIIDIALIQSCISDHEAKPFLRNYGLVIVDECHHVPAVGFEEVLKRVTAQRVYGLTATPVRKDGHQPIIFMQCGPVRYSSGAKEQVREQSFSRQLIPRFTSFRPLTDERQTYLQVIKDLAADALRNRQIVHDAVSCLREGRSPLVLSHLTDHVETLAAMLRPYCSHVIVLTGSKSASERREAERELEGIRSGEPMVILSTDRYMGEGFDCPRLDTLFMTLPISWKENVKQCVGRLHRDFEGKREVRVYDYIDIHIPLCDVMYRRRMRGYRSVGYAAWNGNAECSPEADSRSVLISGTEIMKQLSHDIAGAGKSAVIACPEIRTGSISAIAGLLRKRQAEGIETLIVTGRESDGAGRLRAGGLIVRVSPGLSFECAVIDRTVCWYGELGFTGYISENGNALRIKGEEIAGELLAAVLGDAPGQQVLEPGEKGSGSMRSRGT